MPERIEINVPDGVRGEWRVESFTVTERDSEKSKLRCFGSAGRHDHVPPGDYKRLMRGDTVVMSNTPMEVATNQSFIHAAKGRVLVNGLGLGMVLTAILRKPEVTSVTVVEAARDVIDLVSPSFQTDPRVRIVHADAFAYRPAPGERFDVVWHDIWDEVCSDNLPEMRRLHRKYCRRTGWQASWRRFDCEANAARGR